MISCKYLALGLLMLAFVGARSQVAPKEHPISTDVSGLYYDWKKTSKPEKPWLHDYSQTLVMKMFLCSGNQQVYLNFEEALTEIKKIDNLTLGIPKIIYLVGWQFEGHDTGYPAWSVVNSRLKRPQDNTAIESLRWLIREAKRYHTVVSLHINMIDAYRESPLWKEYFEKDVILKDKSGNPIPGEVFHGVQSYQISYAREWQEGLTQRRIDGLLNMLPELREGGTIHIDAFHSIQPTRPDANLSSPYLGLTINDEIEAQRKLFRYWRLQGIDVTAEDAMYELRRDPFIGLQPMAWWYDLDARKLQRLKWVGKPEGFKNLPADLYVGTPMKGEEEIMKDPERLTGLLRQFCTAVLPWYYDNNTASKSEDAWLWQRGRNVWMPALWRSDTIVAFSEDGRVSKRLELPSSWAQTRTVDVSRVSVDGVKHLVSLPVEAGKITLTIKAGQALVIEKHH